MARLRVLKLPIDICIAGVLLLLMSYGLIGEEPHEWLGVAFFALVIVHSILNRRWYRAVFKGKYAPLRIWQTFLIFAVIVTTVCSAYSALLLSRYALSFLNVKGGLALARTLHMAGAYWGFILASLHLGSQWNKVLLPAAPYVKWFSGKGIMVVRMIYVIISAYGVFVLYKRDIWNYLTFKNQFAFFDFEEPVILFLTDYFAVMFLIAFIGYWCVKAMKRQRKTISNNITTGK